MLSLTKLVPWWLMALCALCADPARSEQSLRENDARHLPEWLRVSGESRVRFETLDGQFRAYGQGGDQLLSFRTLFLTEANLGRVSLGFELQDSRTYMGDAGTPLSNSITNPLDFLQLYARVDGLGGVLGEGSGSSLTIGRQTVSIGSKRQIERVDFANVIKSYTGVHFSSLSPRGDELHAILVVPTARFPNERDDLDDNRLSGDEEQWGRRIWGVHYRRANILPFAAPGLSAELFVYGLEEKDTSDFETADRSHYSPGFRLYRKPLPGRWDIDIEGALRKGERSATTNPADRPALDVDAGMLFAAVGYTFDTPWQPRIALEYYYASGDDGPDDRDFEQHERLFGSRRSDLNNTSIHGPLTPANLSAPGFRVEVKPNSRWDGRFYYHAAYLASDTDAWVIARRRDTTGQSGDFLGHVLDARARYWVVPDSLRLEIGASVLFGGEFVEDAPDKPDAENTYFGYTMLTLTF